MTFLLDTDNLSLVQQGHSTVLNRVNRTPLADMALCTVTLWEQMQGWQSSLTRARDRQQIAQAHERLVVRLLPTWRKFTAVAMTEPAILRFENLITLKLNVGPMDLRIAAVTLESGLIVVTRNLRDFQRVPTLMVEDWSV
jgi:tRNA(fMet)-specific endonuclease VapC